MCTTPKTPQAEAASSLLELAASNDLPAFKHAVEIDNQPIAAAASWYCRSTGSNMISADRTPLMIAATYGSTDVLAYILQHSSTAHINRRSHSDGATALHLAAAGGSLNSHDTVKILLDASADANAVDNSGRRPCDVIAKKKEHAAAATLPDINSGVYGSDEFRMYSFKVKPCSRAYTHDWTECPFVHPAENARRRDPRKYAYSCVPCPEFRKGSCRGGDGCEYAHGVFESWLHPSQYRTRLCKDEVGCSRRVCFFAHRREELRSVDPNAGLTDLELASAAAPKLPSSRLRSSTRDLGVDFELLGLQEAYQQKLLDDIQRAAAAASPRSAWPAAVNNGSNSMAKAIMNSRSAAFAKRSLSVCDRGAAAAAAARSIPRTTTAGLCGWGSPDGKLDWGIQGEELNKLRKSTSFGFRNNNQNNSNLRGGSVSPPGFDEPDLSWVQSLVNDQKQQQFQKMYSNWGEEKMVTSTIYSL